MSPDFPLFSESPYDSGEEVARGGLGRILRSYDRRLGRVVAVKELLARDSKSEGRFIREAKITARLQHPNIVPIHEAGRWENGARFYAMKLVEGRTLSDALAETTNSQDRLLLLPHVIDVAEAVAYAHSRGILHRDLKPANVMVGPFGETVLIDWGLAKDLEEDEDLVDDVQSDYRPRTVTETSDGMVVGTPPYMSPEQARAQEVDERTDVYSLGAMLYQVYSGKRPYEEVRPSEVLVAVVSRPPLPLEDLAPGMPRDLLAIINKAMERNPDCRYPSANEMALELRRFLAGQFVRAHRYSPLEKVWRFAMRNRASVSISVIALLGFVLFGGWSFVRLQQRSQMAQAARELAEQRVQELTLEKARNVLDQDPTEALAWLKRVSPNMRGVASIAAEAVDLGVSKHISTGHVQEIEIVRSKGNYIASASRDGTVRVWNRTGALVSTLKHGARVSALEFGQRAETLLSGDYDGIVRLWRVGQTTPVAEWQGHQGPVMGLALARGGVVSLGRDRKLAFHTEDGELVFQADGPPVEAAPILVQSKQGLLSFGHGASIWAWDIEHQVGRPILTLESPITAGAPTSGREPTLYVGCEDGAVYRIDPSAARSVRLGQHSTRVLALAVSKDGQLAASGDLAGVVRVWSSVSTQLVEVYTGHSERITQLRFSASGAWLASSSWDGTVRVHEVATDETLVLRGHDQVVTDLAFVEPDPVLDGDEVLVSGSWDTSLRFWELHPTHERLFRGHSVGVHAVAFSPDRKWLASGGHDNQVRLWPFDLRKEKARLLSGHSDHVYRLRFSPDAQWLASSSDDRTVRLWSMAGEPTRVLRGHRDDVEELAFSEDSGWLASAGRAGDVYLWPIRAARPHRALRGHDRAVTGVGFLSDGRLVSAGKDGQVLVWSMEGRSSALLRSKDAILALEVVGDRVAAAGAQGQVWIWQAKQNDPSFEIQHRFHGFVQPDVLRLSRDQRFVAVASAQAGLWLCNLAYQLCDPLVGHEARVFDLEFVGSGQVLVSGSGDHSVRLWDVRSLESRVMRGHRAPVFDVEASSDGAWFVSGSGDADVRSRPIQLPPLSHDLKNFLDTMSKVEVEGP